MLIGCYDSAGNMLVKEKGQCLGVAGGSTADGAPVVQASSAAD